MVWPLDWVFTRKKPKETSVFLRTVLLPNRSAYCVSMTWFVTIPSRVLSVFVSDVGRRCGNTQMTVASGQGSVRLFTSPEGVPSPALKKHLFVMIPFCRFPGNCHNKHACVQRLQMWLAPSRVSQCTTCATVRSNPGPASEVCCDWRYSQTVVPLPLLDVQLPSSDI